MPGPYFIGVRDVSFPRTPMNALVMNPGRRALLSVGEVADRAGVSKKLLLFRVERNEVPGPSVKLGGLRLFTEARVNEIERAFRDDPRLKQWPKS